MYPKGHGCGPIKLCINSQWAAVHLHLLLMVLLEIIGIVIYVKGNNDRI